MQATYECIACGEVYERAPTASIMCKACGSLYLRWTNYEQWAAAQEPDRIRPAARATRRRSDD